MWVFFVTAAVTLLVTWGLWLEISRIPRCQGAVWYRQQAQARKENLAFHYGPEGLVQLTKHELAVRIASLIWLVRTGNIVWLWKSRASIAILANSNIKVDRDNADLTGNYNACEYVLKFCREAVVDEHESGCFRVKPNVNARRV